MGGMLVSSCMLVFSQAPLTTYPGVLGGIQATKQFQSAIGNPKGSEIIPVIASIYNLAAGVMSLFVSFFGMKIGRKGTILLGCLLICIGALLQASSYSVGQIIVGRIVAGSGIGCIASAVPTYMVMFPMPKLLLLDRR